MCQSAFCTSLDVRSCANRTHRSITTTASILRIMTAQLSILKAFLAVTVAWSCIVAATAGLESSRKPCFRNEFEASSIGSLLVANFWRDIQDTGCDAGKIFKVYKQYFDKDLTFSLNGAVLVNGLDAVNDAFIQTGVVPGFCETTYVSWGAAQVTILKPGKSFLWEGNENFVPEDPNPAAPPRGRQYEIKLNRRTCRPKITSINAVPEFAI